MSETIEDTSLPAQRRWLDLRAAILMLEQIAGTDAVQRWLRAIDVPAEQRTALVTALVAALKERYNAI